MITLKIIVGGFIAVALVVFVRYVIVDLVNRYKHSTKQSRFNGENGNEN
jgi:hypothetical protein